MHSLDEKGNTVMKKSFENTFSKLGEFLDNFSPNDRFVMESRGYDVILANPLKIKLIAESRMKNDDVDSENLARLLMNGWIPESYVPDRDIREMRRIVRTRIQIKHSCTSYRNRIRFELLRMNVDYEPDPFSRKGHLFPGSLHSPRIDSYLSVLLGMEEDVRRIDRDLKIYSDMAEIRNLQTIPGIGLFSAVLIYSEIGDITRFQDLTKLLPYAGLVPSVRQSSDTVHYGHITYQGSEYLRWIMVEAVHMHMRFDPGSGVSRFYRKIAKKK